MSGKPARNVWICVLLRCGHVSAGCSSQTQTARFGRDTMGGLSQCRISSIADAGCERSHGRRRRGMRVADLVGQHLHLAGVHEPQGNVSGNVLRRSVESAAGSGHAPWVTGSDPKRTLAKVPVIALRANKEWVIEITKNPTWDRRYGRHWAGRDALRSTMSS